jgi:hypothetical protein
MSEAEGHRCGKIHSIDWKSGMHDLGYSGSSPGTDLYVGVALIVGIMIYFIW